MAILDAARLQAGLADETKPVLEQLDVFESVGSTSTFLVEQAQPAAGRLHVAIAEQQTAGRGRHNSAWVSPPGAGLYESLAFGVSSSRADFSALTLALGVGALNALARFGIEGVALKWPNDVVAKDGKLAGILAETKIRNEQLIVVAGIGINVFMDERTREASRSGWAQRGVALADLHDSPPELTDLAIAVTDAMAEVFVRFETEGFAAFAERWRAADWLYGKTVSVKSPAKTLAGVARGVDDAGALLLETADGELAVSSGSVSLLEPAA
ncbi:MAG: biotin--[acetyl-CoA-carboxylase] ligase [Pseudomonadota bacterium]